MFKYKLPKRDNLIFEYENKLTRLHKTLCLIWFIQILHKYKIDHSVFTNTYSMSEAFHTTTMDNDAFHNMNVRVYLSKI